MVVQSKACLKCEGDPSYRITGSARAVRYACPQDLGMVVARFLVDFPRAIVSVLVESDQDDNTN